MKVFDMTLRLYPLENKLYQLIDQTFDKVYRFGLLKFTIVHILFGFFVFLVKKTNTEGKKKRRVIDNIQKPN